MHLTFNIKQWVWDNPNATILDLVSAVSSADEVYCGWTLLDAERIRKNHWPTDTRLNINTSRSVMDIVEDNHNPSIGTSWQDIFNSYDTFVRHLDNS